jgi:hypothetical protein
LAGQAVKLEMVGLIAETHVFFGHINGKEIYG